MPVLAVGFYCVRSGWAMAAKHILPGCYDLKVLRLYAIANTAKVVYLHARWNWPGKEFVDYSVNIG